MNRTESPLYLVGSFQQSILFKIFAVACLLSFPSTWAPWSALLQAEDSSNLSKTIDQLSISLEYFVEANEPEIVSIENVVEECGGHPESLLNWVRKNTSWVSYQGSLKGASGTFESRKGNQLDRALLLHALLSEAGYSARVIQSSELTSTLMESLVLPQEAEVFVKNEYFQSDDPFEGMSEEELTSLSKSLHVSLEEMVTGSTDTYLAEKSTYERFLSVYESQSKLILNRLGDTIKNNHSTPVKEHDFWVQYLDEGKWSDLHLVYGDSVPDDLSASEIVLDQNTALPDSLNHRVDIEIIVKQQMGDEVLSHQALSETIRVAAIANGQFSIGFSGSHSDGFNQMVEEHSDDPDELKSAFAKQLLTETEWTPYLVSHQDNSPIVQKRFDLKGNVRDAASAYDIGTKDALANATSLLGDLSIGSDFQKKEDGQLVGLQMVYRIHRPGVDHIEHVRDLFSLTSDELDTLNNKSDESDAVLKKIRIACAQSRDVMLQVGQYGTNYSLIAAVDYAKSLRLPMTFFSRVVDQGDQKVLKTLEKLLTRISKTNLKLVEFGRMRSTIPDFVDNLYLAETNLFSQINYVDIQNGAPVRYTGMDVIHNAVAAKSSHPDSALDIAKLGVFDTVAESYILKGDSFESEAFGLSGHLGRDPNLSGWSFISDKSQLEEYEGVELETKLNDLQRELDSGYVLLIPDDGEWNNWVRYHPERGELLGMGYSPMGYAGNAAAEDTAIRFHMGPALIEGIISFLGCYSFAGGGDSLNKGVMCALCAALTGVAAGLGVGKSVEWFQKYSSLKAGLCAVLVTQSGMK